MSNLEPKLIGERGKLIDFDKLPSEEPWPIYDEGGRVAGYDDKPGRISYEIVPFRDSCFTGFSSFGGIENTKLKKTIIEEVKKYPELKKGFRIDRFVSGPMSGHFSTGYVGKVEFEGADSAR